LKNYNWKELAMLKEDQYLKENVFHVWVVCYLTLMELNYKDEKFG
jgi:hypothetical protein